MKDQCEPNCPACENPNGKYFHVYKEPVVTSLDSITKLRVKLVAAVRLLRELEWGADDGFGEHDDYICPICGGNQNTEGHAADCKLKEVIG